MIFAKFYVIGPRPLLLKFFRIFECITRVVVDIGPLQLTLIPRYVCRIWCKSGFFWLYAYVRLYESLMLCADLYRSRDQEIWKTCKPRSVN